MKALLISILLMLSSTAAFGSTDSNGPNGINSTVTGLDGTGIAIGQAEGERPAKPDYDTDDDFIASNTDPAGVYRGTNPGMDPPDTDVVARDHATEVAGVMIAKDMPKAHLVGVSPNAELHSIAVGDLTDEDSIALSLNRIAMLNADVKAINISFVRPLGEFEDNDGNSHFSKFIDWSAPHHDVLYVVAWGNDISPPSRKPTDNYNGITIAASQKEDGVYRKFWFRNALMGDAEGARTSIDLMAPGEDISVMTLGDNEILAEGTSIAAPHVTGTVALLQQFAKAKIDAPTPRWGPNSQKHETMKAVMMNSADKLDGVHGSTRTSLDNSIDGNDWLQSAAYMNSDIPLDEDMGAGHLNTNRTVQQFESGEYDPGMVPSIGWDYQAGDWDYVFDTEIGGGYLAATLVWDRRVEKIMDGNYTSGDMFFDQDIDDQMNNLDLYLMPAASNDLMNPTAVSNSTVQNVEHIFFYIETPGEYKLVVNNNPVGGIGDNQEYALAWWFAESPMQTGDYDGNGSVGPEDYTAWRSSFGSTTELDADGNGDNIINAADYVIWRDSLGAGSGSGSLANVPEPSSVALLLAAVTVGIVPLRRWRRS